MSKIRILFFTNNLKRTGSEVVLFNLISKLDPVLFQIGIIALSEKGELVNELPSHITYHSLKTEYNLFNKVQHYVGHDLLLSQLKKIQNENKYSVWYINSLSPAHVLKYAQNFKVKTICHIHELASNYSYITSHVFDLILNSNLIIACSKLVHEEISSVYNGHLQIVKSTIDLDFIDKLNLNSTQSINNDIIILCAGTVSYRKGTDLFIQVAKKLIDRKFKFVWIGQFSNTGYSSWIKKTHKKLSHNNVEFIIPKNQKEYYTLIKSSSLYFSTSREESLGLSMLEAIYLGKPVIALNSGGASLIIDDTNGMLINSFNIQSISFEIEDYIQNKLESFDSSLNQRVFDNYNQLVEFNHWQDLLKKVVL
jgi:glycosyltransferase involved in cell wall biosynthesis